MNYINKYYQKLEELKHFSTNETSIRRAFENLLDSCANERKLTLVAELPYYKNSRNIPDGTLKDPFRFDIGYWEAKDESDDLDTEIEKKLKKGYPNSNIIFEDSKRAVLIQNGETIADIEISKRESLEQLLKTFFEYEKPEILEFRKALEQFTLDIPKIVDGIREKISKAEIENSNFKEIYLRFVHICQNSIDRNISKTDIYEMLIQHILTEDIFRVIFSESEFHIHNNIAKTLNELENSLFDRNEKRELFNSIRYYYEAIKSHSTALQDYREKQTFLNSLYENFYKAYNPKRADKLGIVYTPLEIVDFMINSTDAILYKFFKKTLASENVNILDPATGTGTFLTQIMNHLPKNDLIRKYKNELFANEISILPYYIANLNLEYIYQQKTGKYAEFENISFVDTLDLTKNRVGQGDLFAFSDENFKRIEEQENSDFTVIIGNPPYNANQQNENDNNKNREYEYVDKRIKDTYVKNSNAQKTKAYDMYSRFYRWASDRIQKSGMIAFVTNSSFIDSKTFDGFRKSLFDEFTEIFILDLGGNIRKNPKLSGTRNNVFGIQTGVAILFLIKRETKNPCKVWYLNPFEELEIAEEKLKWLKENRENFYNLDWNLIIPDNRNNWLNQTENGWETFLPMGTKETKLGKDENAIFRTFSNGVVTARDDWVYDFSKENLEKKIEFFIEKYNSLLSKKGDFDTIIKWSRDLKKKFERGLKLDFSKEKIRKSLYRPFLIKSLYFENILNDVQGLQPKFFPKAESENLVIGVTDGTRLDFSTISMKYIPNLAIFSLDPTQTFPFWTYENGEKVENITDFGLEKFREKYGEKVEKIDIFNYIYGVLHFPKYRTEFEINLKQDLPRIPFYENFWHFAEIGEKLLKLHIDFENAREFEIDFGEIDHNLFKSKKFLEFFPERAFEYKLGNRSAIEWVIDGYREKKIKDPTVSAKFNNYKFADYRDEILSLLKKVTTVSLESLKLVKKLE
jgi:predicted helicase